MAIYKCKMCSGELDVSEGVTIVECDFCGTKQTVPTAKDENLQGLFNRANVLRQKSEFDKAAQLYEKIIEKDETQAEAYWGLILCKFGIEYVEDPATLKRVPTCHRTSYDSIISDDDYKSAINYADSVQRGIYEAEAKEIDRLQKEIIAISQKEEPYDVFICYKETDSDGKRTQDSVIANDIYYQLTQEGLKVFYAAITLEDKLGSAYEPCIFAALNSAKVMLVIGTKPEYFTAVWVKNEWSRFLKIVEKDRSKLLIPCYRDMDAYELPEEFAHLQAQDMSKIGFINDVVRGIKKVAQLEEKATVVKETVVTSGSADTAPLLKRAFMFLEDGDWNSADEYCEKVLDLDPENAMAYLGKLMAELHVKKQEDLKNCRDSFEDNSNYMKIVRFGDDSLITTLAGYTTYIEKRNENARLDRIYADAQEKMASARTENEYKKAAELFKSISEHKDANSLADSCIEKAEIARKDAILSEGKGLMKNNNIANYESAIETFKSIPGWKDSDEKVSECQKRIEELKAKAEEDRIRAECKAEADRIERERKAEEERVERERIAKRNKKIAIITTPICAIIAFVIVLNTVIIPNSKYNDAIALMDAGKYEYAILAFEALDGYKDSGEKITESKYNEAADLMEAGKYEEAIVAFEVLDGYKDSATKIVECNEGILDVKYGGKYNDAIALMGEEKYTEAISVFETLDGYKDSATKITECNTGILESKYNDAIALMGVGNIVEAYESLMALDGYKDSDKKAESIYDKYKVAKLKVAKVGDYVFFGAYEQDNNTSNGKEDIEWLVLEVKDGKALIISEYALDCKQYNKSNAYYREKDINVTWETCTLRSWLNNEFLNKAFTDKEKNMIPTVTVSADKNPEYDTPPGNATKDKVFLLSITEVNKYFTSDSSRKCKYTDYVFESRVRNSSENGFCRWWLRSPGQSQDRAALVSYVGSVLGGGDGVSVDFDAVRPAMWINLN